jgi:hypothetical protein
MAIRNVEPIFRPDTTQSVAVSASSAATSAGIGAQSYAIRLFSTTDCFVKLGPAGTTATTSDMLFPANHVEYFRATPGQYVAAIQLTANGTLYVTELTH